jgi:hypothetical protein
MAAIDFHAHAFPDEIAERAMDKLQAGSRISAAGDGTVEGLVASMDAADVDVSVVCAIATRPGQARGIRKWCKKIRGDRIEPMPSLHPDDRKPGKLIEQFAADGFVGVKLHPHYQGFAADEQRMDDIYRALADTGLLLAVHCGLDFAFPDDDDRGGPVRWARVLDRIDGLRCVLTHMGGYRNWDDVERLILGREVYIETSFSLPELGPQRATEMIRRHGPEKVLFGTDWPWRDQAEELRHLASLELTDLERSAVAVSNAGRLLA